LKKPKNQR